MGHGHATTVVGERNVCVTSRPCCLGYRFNGGGAVGPVGMDIKIAANVRLRHNARQLVRGGERYLTAILPQFGRDKCQPELLIDFLFG